MERPPASRASYSRSTPAHVVEAVRNEDGAVAIDVHVDPNAEPTPEPRVVAFMRIGMLSRWKFVL